jgi:hypothetical protein
MTTKPSKFLARMGAFLCLLGALTFAVPEAIAGEKYKRHDGR